MAVAEKHETLESIFSRNFDPSKFHLKATKIAWRWLEDHRKNCHNVVPPQFWVGLQPPLSIDIYIYIYYIYTIFPTDWSYKLTLLMVTNFGGHAASWVILANKPSALCHPRCAAVTVILGDTVSYWNYAEAVWQPEGFEGFQRLACFLFYSWNRWLSGSIPNQDPQGIPKNGLAMHHHFVHKSRIFTYFHPDKSPIHHLFSSSQAQLGPAIEAPLQAQSKGLCGAR